jgi:hypothetical protein
MLWLPPIVIAMKPLVLTWKTWWGSVKCWWRNSHKLQPVPRGSNAYRILTCERCGMWVQILGEEELEVVIQNTTFKKIRYTHIKKATP